jgi:general secretion pathway protein G
VGFTLIELLVVVMIIGLLAGFVAPRYFGQVGKSEVNVAKAQLDALGKALDQYRLDTGHYPPTELGLAALVQRPANEPKWSGPYLRKDVPLDPWGKPYIYKTPGEKGGDFDLLSLGKDGQPGGTGENADITN